ncbi:PH domain-containing protein [Corticicoccus populi]|uniref:PH domain-containing protein n=1 Tax=Corticicoccus populi TaxID=1812821 RepID=A0ABW5WTS7_9STAP
MIFRSKMDRGFKILMTIVLTILTLSMILPVFSPQTDYLTAFFLAALFIVTTGLILWTVLHIKYVMYDDYLYVQGGPFRSRIKYSDIIGIKKTNHIAMGFRIVSSSDAVEISYKSGFWGHVIISPEDRDLFIEELEKRRSKLN